MKKDLEKNFLKDLSISLREFIESKEFKKRGSKVMPNSVSGTCDDCASCKKVVFPKLSNLFDSPFEETRNNCPPLFLRSSEDIINAFNKSKYIFNGYHNTFIRVFLKEISERFLISTAGKTLSKKYEGIIDIEDFLDSISEKKALIIFKEGLGCE